MVKQQLNEEFRRMQQLAGIKPLYEAYTGPKSKLEKIIQQAWGESDINAAKKLVIDFISPSKIKSKDQIINTIKGLTNKREFDRYMANALLKFEKLGLSEEQVNENNLSEAWDWDINEFGEYNSSTKTFEIFMDGDGFSDYMDTEFPGWLEDEDITDEGRKKFIEDIKNAVKEKYGPGVKIEGEGFNFVMKKQINEVRRMQKLASILKEGIEQNQGKILYVQPGNVVYEFGIQTEEGVKLLNKALGDENVGYLSYLTTEVINKLLSSPLYPKIAAEAKKAMNALALSGIEQDLEGVILDTNYRFVLDDGKNIDKKDGPIATLEFSEDTFDIEDTDHDEKFEDYLKSKGFNVKMYSNEIGTFVED